ncbi:MAG: hypothetical protein KBT28_10785 [Bacteroidales bacterium]|nr:hypothetical protein [Candidatus Colimorpha merdihippi]
MKITDVKTEEDRKKFYEEHKAHFDELELGEEVRVDSPTPNGGAYSVQYFYDKNRRPCKKEDAYMYVICEYDENDNYINSVYSFIEQTK